MLIELLTKHPEQYRAALQTLCIVEKCLDLHHHRGQNPITSLPSQDLTRVHTSGLVDAIVNLVHLRDPQLVQTIELAIRVLNTLYCSSLHSPHLEQFRAIIATPAFTNSIVWWVKNGGPDGGLALDFATTVTNYIMRTPRGFLFSERSSFINAGLFDYALYHPIFLKFIADPSRRPLQKEVITNILYTSVDEKPCENVAKWIPLMVNVASNFPHNLPRFYIPTIVTIIDHLLESDPNDQSWFDMVLGNDGGKRIFQDCCVRDDVDEEYPNDDYKDKFIDHMMQKGPEDRSDEIIDMLLKCGLDDNFKNALAQTDPQVFFQPNRFYLRPIDLVLAYAPYPYLLAHPDLFHVTLPMIFDNIPLDIEPAELTQTLECLRCAINYDAGTTIISLVAESPTIPSIVKVISTSASKINLHLESNDPSQNTPRSLRRKGIHHLVGRLQATTQVLTAIINRCILPSPPEEQDIPYSVLEM